MLGLDKKPQAPQPQQGDQPMFLGQQKHVGGVDKFTEMANEVNNLSRRLRVIEERYTNMRRKVQVSDQNMLQSFKRVNTEVQLSNNTINEMHREIDDIKDKVRLIIKELKMTSTKDEVNTLQKYINLWEPINFVTQSEVERIVRRIVDEKLNK
ncbi:hypothetical protein JW968_05105 [Candidatus Woesearchaeota archaeon]|nr:hypothetical protein [Candidatus Woesearchaeota archaeon]